MNRRLTAGTGHSSAIDGFLRPKAEHASTLLGALAALVLVAGCDADIRDGVGPSVPEPNVDGVVVRAGAPAEDLDVDLRIEESAVVVESTKTGPDGEYAFADVPLGDWEVKVSSHERGDFDAVSRVFRLETDGAPTIIPIIDVGRHGAEMVEPSDGARTAPPSPFQWLTFRWVLPDVEVEYARVQVYDEDNLAVWFSDKEPVSEMSWNGIGNEGDFDGRAVGPGLYRWRVKIGLVDGSEARLRSRELILE